MGTPFEWFILIALITIHYVGLYFFRKQYDMDMKDVREYRKLKRE